MVGGGGGGGGGGKGWERGEVKCCDIFDLNNFRGVLRGRLKRNEKLFFFGGHVSIFYAILSFHC